MIPISWPENDPGIGQSFTDALPCTLIHTSPLKGTVDAEAKVSSARDPELSVQSLDQLGCHGGLNSFCRRPLLAVLA